MNVIKLLGKVAGTATMVAAGTTVLLLNELIEMAGKGDTSVTILADLQDTCFDTIKKIWNPEKYEEYVASGEAADKAMGRRIATKTNAATKVLEMAENAKKRGDTEQYKAYQQRFYELTERSKELQRERDEL